MARRLGRLGPMLVGLARDTEEGSGGLLAGHSCGGLIERKSCFDPIGGKDAIFGSFSMVFCAIFWF